MRFEDIIALAKTTVPTTIPGGGTSKVFELIPVVPLFNQHNNQVVLIDKVLSNERGLQTAHVQGGVWYEVAWFEPIT